MKPAVRARGESAPVLKLRLTIAYDGTAYAGWQVQKVGLGVQEKVEAAVQRLFPGAGRLHSSSRTDTGVHALGMVAHVEVPPTRIPNAKIALALNAHLPEDIRIVDARRCRPGFHARFDARAKQYRYLVWNARAMNPLLRHQAWHVPRALDVPAMRRAARQLLGRHNFKSFSANPNYIVAHTTRTLYRCDLRRAGPLLTFIIEGDGFLYRMCRGLVGTLVQVGLGRFSVADLRQMLTAGDRRAGGMTAPAHGLVLWKVFYGGKKPRRPGLDDQEQPQAPLPLSPPTSRRQTRSHARRAG